MTAVSHFIGKSLRLSIKHPKFQHFLSCYSLKYVLTKVSFDKDPTQHFKKNYKYGIKAPIRSHSCIFFEMKYFLFPKKITSVGSSAFQKNLQRLDQPTLVSPVHLNWDLESLHLIQSL